MHDDDVMRRHVLGHEVTDAPFDSSPVEQLGRGLFVAGGELDIRHASGAGLE